jgi:hypothetical protein
MPCERCGQLHNFREQLIGIRTRRRGRARRRGAIRLRLVGRRLYRGGGCVGRRMARHLGLGPRRPGDARRAWRGSGGDGCQLLSGGPFSGIETTRPGSRISSSACLAVSIPAEEFILSRLTESPAPGSRSLAKSASRAADRVAVAESRRSVSGVKKENEVFASFAVGARIDLSASRRLA